MQKNAKNASQKKSPPFGGVLPASGYRNGDTGVMVDLAIRGHYWLAEAESTQSAWRPVISVGITTISPSSAVGHALPLRCIKI